MNTEHLTILEAQRVTVFAGVPHTIVEVPLVVVIVVHSVELVPADSAIVVHRGTDYNTGDLGDRGLLSAATRLEPAFLCK